MFPRYYGETFDQTLVASCQSLVASYQSLVTNHLSLVTSDQLLVTGYQSLVTSHFLLVASYQPLVISYQLLVASNELLFNTSCQFLINYVSSHNDFVKDIPQKYLAVSSVYSSCNFFLKTKDRLSLLRVWCIYLKQGPKAVLRNKCSLISKQKSSRNICERVQFQ